MQAVALNINGDKAVFYRIRIFGAQDTLMDLSGTHYFYQCFIQGSIDFIFGGARSLYLVQGLILMMIILINNSVSGHSSIQLLGILLCW